jgi:hypothetical protein
MIKAKLLTDKIKDSKAKTFYAKSGEIIFVYDTTHGDVYLVKNSKEETFSCRSEFLKIIE